MRRSLFALAWVFVFALGATSSARAQQLLVPMDLTQTNHLKAYGLAFGALRKAHKSTGCSTIAAAVSSCPTSADIVLDARVKNVGFVEVTGSDVAQIMAEIAQNNMDVVHLEKAPKVAIYCPPLEAAVGRRRHAGPRVRGDSVRARVRRRRAGGRPREVRLAAPAPRGLHRSVRQVLRRVSAHRLVSGRPARRRGARARSSGSRRCPTRRRRWPRRSAST